MSTLCDEAQSLSCCIRPLKAELYESRLDINRRTLEISWGISATRIRTINRTMLKNVSRTPSPLRTVSCLTLLNTFCSKKTTSGSVTYAMISPMRTGLTKPISPPIPLPITLRLERSRNSTTAEQAAKVIAAHGCCSAFLKRSLLFI